MYQTDCMYCNNWHEAFTHSIVVISLLNQFGGMVQLKRFAVSTARAGHFPIWVAQGTEKKNEVNDYNTFPDLHSQWLQHFSWFAWALKRWVFAHVTDERVKP